MALGSRAHHNPTGNRHEVASERNTPASEIIDGNRLPAQRYAQGADIGIADKKVQLERSRKIKAFISSDEFTLIKDAKNKLNAATFVVRNNPYLVPKSVVDDIQHQAAFLVALVDELQKSEYHQ
jgi:hypothetical protein